MQDELNKFRIGKMQSNSNSQQDLFVQRQTDLEINKQINE